MGEEKLISTQFTVLTEILKEEEAIHLVGNCHELGNWDTSKALKMNYKINETKNKVKTQMWNIFVELEANKEIEYKFIHKKGKRLLKWESMPMNRKYVPVSKDEHPKLVEFGKWYNSFQSMWVDQDWLVEELLLVFLFELSNNDTSVPGLILDSEFLEELEEIYNTKVLPRKLEANENQNKSESTQETEEIDNKQNTNLSNISSSSSSNNLHNS
eukprot:Anaeramoba_flamelloidesa1060683_61.p1 GENE.a1060683_61~~a1060683_61.p1  ORF type:complete len:214 (-),score=49.99 a1060683_61:121-762(-)